MGHRIELLTERLHLRRAKKGDAAVLFENYTGSETCSRFLQRRADPDATRTQAMLTKWCDTAWDLDDDAPFAWVISTRAAGEAIGIFLVIPHGHKTEIHYGVAERFWGQGLVAEAGLAALSALWRNPATQRIWTVCDPENIGSRRVLEKLGLQCEGTLKKWLVLPAFGDEARDCLVFSTTSRPAE
ncbi:ribosomal-protein-alanine N-acetyltransferase [Paraburkholderia phenazinium]|jgi:ribosomal-protein-alanine N-acetyltransferase|uniref:Ribosomal-protein-alanine N-acetyltransferase n=1 Tax=Paraburkholderia phenazinium TaxID=60549 RepID=A0A1N6LET2_9BURK|nr:ribosomal-protein-alanine N-acetyltransferase [Paraburkholderia phenazinium]